MKKINLYFYFVGIMIALSACGTGNETLNFASMGENSSVRDAITGKWKLTSKKIDDKKVSVKDCEQDNTLLIQGDGAYVSDNGVTQCNNNETNDVGTWSLSDNDRELTFAGNEDTQTIALKGVDNTKLAIEVNVTKGGKSHLETLIYTKIQ